MSTTLEVQWVSTPSPLLLILAEKLFLDLTITCYGCDDNHMQYYHFPNDWSCFALPDIIYVLMADGQLVGKTGLGSRLKFSSIVKWIPNQILWNDALELTSFFVPWHKRRLSLSPLSRMCSLVISNPFLLSSLNNQDQIGKL